MSAAAWEVLKTRANHLRCARVAALVRRQGGLGNFSIKLPLWESILWKSMEHISFTSIQSSIYGCLWMFFMEDRRVDTLSSAPRPAENNIPMEVPLDCLSHPFKADLEKKPCKDYFFGLCHIADGCCCTICLLFKFTWCIFLFMSPRRSPDRDPWQGELLYRPCTALRRAPMDQLKARDQQWENMENGAVQTQGILYHYMDLYGILGGSPHGK